MLVRKNVDENGLPAMLAAKRSGVAPEVNPRECRSTPMTLVILIPFLLFVDQHKFL